MKLLVILVCFLPVVLCDDVDNQRIFNALQQTFDVKFGADMTSDINSEANTEVIPQVSTTNGVLMGAMLTQGYGFYSVPYAKPPIGERRFMPPEPAEKYKDDKLDVSKINGLACYQTPSECSQGLCFDNLSEDCLVLNVHVPFSVDLTDPTAPSTERLPVIVWIHGGGLFTGSGTSPLYDGRYLSNVTNTIVVSVNYRLAALGFLVLNDSASGVVRNQGLADQQMALQWVQDNIENFGGDKTKVTLMGNSAGAQSVMFHLMSHKSDPLFHRAIMQSPPAVFQYPSIDDALFVTERVLENLNCSENSIDCLRSVEPEALVRQTNVIRAMSLVEADLFTTIEPFGFVLDGDEFTENPIQFVQHGGWHGNKEVLIGTNVDEMVAIPLYIPDHEIFSITKEIFENFLQFVFGDELGMILVEEYSKQVPEGAGEDFNYDFILGQLATDGLFICPVRAYSRLMSQLTSTYLYSFAHVMDDPSCEVSWKPPSACDYVFHSAENSFVFRSAPLISYNFSTNDLKAVDQFSYYWGNFAHCGDPSCGQVTLPNVFLPWPKYMENEEMLQIRSYRRGGIVSRITEPWINYVINTTGSTDSSYHQGICDFWDSTKYYVDLSRDEVTTTTTDDVTTTQIPVNNEETTSGVAHLFGSLQIIAAVTMTTLTIIALL